MQGAAEQRTVAVQGSTAERAAEAGTQQRAAKGSSSGGSAGDEGALSLVLLPLFHPAAALYNGGMRQTLIDDFATIPIILGKLQESK